MAPLRKTAPSFLLAAPGSTGGLWQVAQVWIGRSRTRQALAALDPHLLRDIGMEPDKAAIESDKPFWRD